MCVVILFFLITASSCSDNLTGSVDEDVDVVSADLEKCSYEGVEVVSPCSPVLPDVTEKTRYQGKLECRVLPEIIDGKMILDEGCYSGCVEISGDVSVVGEGSDKTLIVCEDDSVEAAFFGKDVNLKLAQVSINSKTRGVSLDGKSVLKTDRSAIYDCFQGGIKACVTGGDCFSDVLISDSLIADGSSKSSDISYGVTIGRGNLEIKNSKLEGFNSFAVAVWGESDLVIEDSEIKDIHGVSGDFHGVGIYSENSDVYLERVSVSNVATSFIYVVNDTDVANTADFRDVVLSGGVLESDEQGGVVLDGKINAEISRISISESRGNGIFGNGVTINGKDLEIRGVDSDLTTENGFGIVLFDSEAKFRNVVISEARKVGLLVDGSSNVVIDNFQISETRADAVIGEFGLGAAVQGGAFLSIENGVVAKNRECGVMAVNAELVMKNVEIVDTLPRKCSENGNCTFAPGVPFGHGVSIYSDSKLSFRDLFINNNSNGINIESSQVQKISEGGAFLVDNSCAVNAWNIDDEKNLEKAFEDVTFCNNKSIFTTDVQPVREGL